MTTKPIILGLDPGTRYLGAVVLCGGKLLTYAVHELRNGERIYDLLGEIRPVVFRYIDRFSPQIVAIERPYIIDSNRAVALRALVQEIRRGGQDLGLDVVQLSPEEVRLRVVGRERASKIDVAEAVTRRGFGELREILPSHPTHAHPTLRSRDRYWLHVFDALGVAVAAAESHVAIGRQTSMAEVANRRDTIREGQDG